DPPSSASAVRGAAPLPPGRWNPEREAYVCLLCSTPTYDVCADDAHVESSRHQSRLLYAGAPPEYDWLKPREHFELQDHMGFQDWKCLLCNKWADEGHVKSATHQEALQRFRARSAQAARASEEASRASARVQQQQRRARRVLTVRCWSPGRRHVECEGRAGQAQPPLDAAAFAAWPLKPRPGDQLTAPRGPQPPKLVGQPEALDVKEMGEFVDGFADRVRENTTSACSMMLIEYHGYMHWILEKGDFSKAGAVAERLLGILADAVAAPCLDGARSAARTWLRQAIPSRFVGKVLPALLGTSPPHIVARAAEFAEQVVAQSPEALAYVCPLLNAAVERDGAEVARMSRCLREAGDALARDRGLWDAVSWRRLPTAPALLSPDLADLSALPSAKPSYASTEEYLDTMYRLLRANCFASVQRGVRNILEGRAAKEDVRMYRARVQSCGLLVRGAGGFVVKMLCEPLQVGAHARPSRGRALQHGAIVAVSLASQAFARVAWGRVLDRQGGARCGIEAKLEWPEDLNGGLKGFDLLMALLSATERQLLCAEAPVFFQAHGPVLRVLQSMDAGSLPLGEALLGGEAAEAATQRDVVPGAPAVEARLRRNLEEENIKLDPKQAEALERLVRRPLAVVQGPPGTGKTFTSLLAVKALTATREGQEGDDPEVSGGSSGEEARAPEGDIPVLVLCDKNHALDEFLVKALRFTKRLVRLGGRASDELQGYNLQSMASQQPKDPVLGRRLRAVFEERVANRDSIVAMIAELFESTALPRLLLTRATLEQLKSLVNGCPVQHSSHEAVSNYLEHGLREDVGPEDLELCLHEWLRDVPMRLRSGGHPAHLDAAQREEREESSDDDPDDRAGHQQSLGAQTLPLEMPDWRGFDVTVGSHAEALEAAAAEDLWSLGAEGRAALLQHWLSSEAEAAKAEVDAALEVDALLGARLAELERQRSTAVLRSAQIVACTISGAAMRAELLREVGFRDVVVEEAAEILEPQLLAALPATTRRLLLVGDHEQLRPRLEEE
ncbi:unnamed protein product, partial [Prorocentrum cordatum]